MRDYSESPAIDSKVKLIGLVFDRIWHFQKNKFIK